jgi:hypothetical protein
MKKFILSSIVFFWLVMFLVSTMFWPEEITDAIFDKFKRVWGR